MKIVSIHQPAYLPWLGYFHKVAVADTFVVLDHVQFEKGSFINRNRILQPDGRLMWLTVPVLTKGDSKQKIGEIEIDWNNWWASKHVKAIELCYSKTPYWGDHSSVIKNMLEFLSRTKSTYTLVNVLDASMGFFLSALGLSSDKVKFSSLYAPPFTQTKSDLVLEICRREGADVYFSGALGKGYLEEEKFRVAGIEIIFQNYSHPEYKQHQSKDHPFMPYMSTLDLLMNHGPESLTILMRDNVTRKEIKNEH